MSVGMVALSLVVVACGGSTAPVVIDTVVEDLENGTFTATSDLFDCDGRWDTPDLQFHEGDTWSFDSRYVCSDGSGTLVLRADGEGPAPTGGQSVGTWTVISGTGDYEGLSGEGSYDLFLDPWSERFEGELTSG